MRISLKIYFEHCCFIPCKLKGQTGVLSVDSKLNLSMQLCCCLDYVLWPKYIQRVSTTGVFKITGFGFGFTGCNSQFSGSAYLRLAWPIYFSFYRNCVKRNQAWNMNQSLVLLTGPFGGWNPPSRNWNRSRSQSLENALYWSLLQCVLRSDRHTQ